MNALEIENLSVNYDKAPGIWDLSLRLPKGVLCGIAGPNGAGKSTLLKAIMGLIRPLSGKIAIFGKPNGLDKIAYVPQRESIDWDFPITALDVVLMGRYSRFGLFGRPRQADRDAAIRALEQLGMLDLANRQISQLSGGQQQRLFIARALVQEADLYLMDEPFAGVDLATEEIIFELLRREKALGKTIVIVFHDLHLARQMFDWLILLNRRLISCGPIDEVLQKEHLLAAFGKNCSLFEDAALLSKKTTTGLL